jgi:hypothetical protein
MYVIYDMNSKALVGNKRYCYKRVAIRNAKKLAKKSGMMLNVTTQEDYANAYGKRTRRVRSLINGAELEISNNTPMCCDPSSETYLSM